LKNIKNQVSSKLKQILSFIFFCEKIEMAFRCKETGREPGRLSSYLRVFAKVSDPKEIEEVENDQLPLKEAEILKRRRAKKLHENEDFGAGAGAGAPSRSFGDNIKFSLDSYNEPVRSDDPRFELLLDPDSGDDFHLRNELNFDLETVTRFKGSQDSRLQSQQRPVGHDLQWLEQQLEVTI
jgi:hypothetical protein